MKIHLYCNTLNISYSLGKVLKELGYDVKLFLDNTSPLIQDFPWHIDRDMTPENFPSWIVYYKIAPDFIKLDKETKALIEDFSKGDVALVWGWGPILCHFAKIPYFFCSLGADLNNIKISEKIKYIIVKKLFGKKQVVTTPLKIEVKAGSTYSGLHKLFIYILQRRFLKEAYAIGIGMGYQINPYMKRFGLLDKMVKIRGLHDMDYYKKSEDDLLNNKYSKYNCIFFAPARHSWSNVWEDIKGNDKYIRAFAAFVKKYNPNCKLVTITKGVDVDLSKQLIEELGIGNYVEWLPEMDKEDIIKFLSIPNCVIIDQFMHDKWYLRYPEDKAKVRVGFGFASVEALALEKVIITAFEDEMFYENNQPPILKAFTIAEIENAMATAYNMSANERVDLGKKAREFAIKYHDWKNNIHIYTDVLTDLYNKTKLAKA